MDFEIKVGNLASFLTGVEKAPATSLAHLSTAIRTSILYVNRTARLDKLNKYVYGTPEKGYRRTGNLRNRWDIDIQPLQASTGPDVTYAQYVHDGTRYMQSRPFLLEAVNDGVTDISGFFETEMQGAIDEIAGVSS